jgi:hypothetical protein
MLDDILPKIIVIIFLWMLISSSIYEHYAVHFHSMIARDYTRYTTKLINGSIIIMLPVIYHLIQSLDVIYYFILINIIHSILELLDVYETEPVRDYIIHIMIWLFMFIVDEDELRASLVIFSINGISNIGNWYNEFVSFEKRITMFAFKMQYIWYVCCRLFAFIKSLIYLSEKGLFMCAVLNLITVAQTIKGLIRVYLILKSRGII